ncbi:uncharacterized protein LOC116351327 [Contarinia nasturtii]|uniref:uncharacterized protein LOC116351327 n=1 Tax=Contarinia nasturtii TaxID=265458 RepID=UPI0012D3DC45|nr:uncharacterized protein LOC116351327 [Contarinia nasturtii]
MNCLVVKFRHRLPNDISNKYLAEIYVKGPQFDIDLIASDQKVVSAHKYVVSMFSIYLKDYLREFKPKGKACVPLSDISSFVLKQVIDLFYNGQIMIGAEVKPHMIKALAFLKVNDVWIRSPEPEELPAQLNKDWAPDIAPVRTDSRKQPPLMQQNISRNMSMNNDQCQWSQPAKRGRTQSVFMERDCVRDCGMFTNPSPSMVQSGVNRIGSVSIMNNKALSSNVGVGSIQRPIPNQMATHPNKQQSLPKNMNIVQGTTIGIASTGSKVSKTNDMDRDSDDMDIDDMSL